MFALTHAISPEDSFSIEKAILFLVGKYESSGHNPKPVILHSLRVASILMEMGYDKRIIIGAVLHDIIEDADVTEDDVKQNFGGETLALVNAVSYDGTISDPVEQYKEMFDRVLSQGRDAVVVKAVDIAVNSLYIDLVSDAEKRRLLIEKGRYFLELTKDFSSEPAWKLLKKRNTEELSKLL